MKFSTCRRYEGPVKAGIVDCAGTIVDYGSCAPAGAFVELFGRHGVSVSLEQARGPMGKEKKDHIRALGRLPEVTEQWRRLQGRELTEEDIDVLYDEFIPLQLQALPRYGELIPGTLEFLAAMKAREIKVGATTGYNREMTALVLQKVREQKFVSDAAVCAADVAAGRPAPWMIFRCMELLDAYPPESIVKIGDTIPDIEAGLNAGVWTIGVTKTGNMLGLNRGEVKAMDDETLERMLLAAATSMQQAGAHYAVPSIGDCIAVIDEIGGRLRNGERP